MQVCFRYGTTPLHTYIFIMIGLIFIPGHFARSFRRTQFIIIACAVILENNFRYKICILWRVRRQSVTFEYVFVGDRKMEREAFGINPIKLLMRFRENFSLLPANTQRENHLFEISRISANLQLCGPNSCHARIFRISTRQFITIIIYQETVEKQKEVRRHIACNRRHSWLQTMANTRAILID